jgi:thiol-disulfide isomerase/thioredoxin
MMHRMNTSWIVALALTLGLGISDQASAAKKDVKVGDRIGNLTFKDIHYLPRSLDDFPNKKAFVLAFTTTSCPVVQRYLPLLKQLEKDYRKKGVQFLAVNVGADDTIVNMAAQAVRHEMEFPFVKDFDDACVRALGVQRTPEVVVLDGQRTLRYRGRIDDQYRLGGTREAATRQDLKEALDAVVEGKEVAVKETPVDGCLITLSEPRTPNSQVNFAEHVAPIMQKHCQECHRPNTSAPFSLISYKQVAAKADAIAEVVTEGRMPPWYASDEAGHFINRRSLSAEERDTLLDWLRLGKPMGDEAKLPKEVVDTKADGKWLIGTPDLVLAAPKHDLPVSGDIPYKYVPISLPPQKGPYQFQEDTWMQGIQILPDNPRVVHHCNMLYFIPGDGYKKSNFITGTVPGGSPMVLNNDLAFLIPKKAQLLLQIHYVSTGKPEQCQIKVGFRHARGTVQKKLRHFLLEDNHFAIPPGAPAHPVGAAQVLDRDAVGIGLFVHMHVRGRDMAFKAQYPDGKSETLLVVPNYSFDWQIPYVWEPGKKVFPKGTRLECLAHYDNSTFNPYNPDPKATVKDGLQTRDEMLNGFVFYADANEQLNLQIDPKTGGARTDTK